MTNLIDTTREAHEGVLVLTDRCALDHDPGAAHPERPARLRAIIEALSEHDSTGWTMRMPGAFVRDHAERVHTSAYLDHLESCRYRSVVLDEDTRTSEASIDVAEYAAAAAVDAVDALMQGAAGSAFVMMRPPGHHAEADRAMGFCFLNNIAIAAAHAISAHRAQRVMVVDWDVHHGNGTQHIFEHRDDVLVVNMHQWPLWPGTGLADEIGFDAGAGHTINVPMAEGRTDVEYEAVMHNLIRPIAHAYQPALILVSAGFDAHERDPIGGMRVTTAGFGRLCARMRRIAIEVCDGRLALMLEGGYDLAALTSSTLACLDVLCAPECPSVQEALTYSPDAERTWAHIQRYWPGARA